MIGLRPKTASVMPIRVLLLPALCLCLPAGSALGQSAGATLKAREKAVLMGQGTPRATLLPGQGGAASPPPQPQISEDGAASPAAPQSMSVSVSEIASRVGGPQSKLSSGILDFWVEGRYEPYEAGSVQRRLESGSMSVVSAGTSYKLGPDIMIGALASLDQGTLDDLRSGADVETSGWVAGPFASVRLGGGVVFDGRVAWGDGSLEETHGGAASSGAYERTLIKGSLRGGRDISGWTVTPMVGVTYIEESPVGGSERAESTANRDGRVEFTPEVKKRVPISSSVFVEPSFAAGAFVPIDEKQGGAALPSAADVQLKAEAGMAVGVTDGVTVKAQGGVETTAGPQAPDVWSGRLQLNMPLGK